MEEGRILYKNNTHGYPLLCKSSKMHIMQQSFKIFKQLKHKATKIQENSSVR